MATSFQARLPDGQVARSIRLVLAHQRRREGIRGRTGIPLCDLDAFVPRHGASKTSWLNVRFRDQEVYRDAVITERRLEKPAPVRTTPSCRAALFPELRCLELSRNFILAVVREAVEETKGES